MPVSEPAEPESSSASATRAWRRTGILPPPLTVVGLLRFSLAAVLLVAAAAKLVSGRSGREALRSYEIAKPGLRAALWAATIGAETSLALAVAAGLPGATEAAAGLLAFFTLALVLAIARGRAGAPCGCLGGRSRIGWPGVGRAALLAAAFAVLPFLPDTTPSTETWLGIGLAVALAGLAVLGVAVLALARELGELRLAVRPQAALSLEHEGPERGSRLSLVERFERRAPILLAVFTSPGCALCHALEPSLQLVASDPEVELETFDEEEDAEAWRSLAIPGSPYGVVLAPDGEVLAKGTFNNLFQLESLIADAMQPTRA